MNTVIFTLAQLVVYAFLLLVAEYAGFMAAVFLGSIALFVWLISYLTEWVEPSKVSRNYYAFVLSCWLGPLLALIGYSAIRGGFNWMLA